MDLREKINYLEKKFNVPMYAIMQAINICKKEGIDVTEIHLITERYVAHK